MEKSLNHLEGYLRSRGSQVSTIWSHVKNARRFLNWLSNSKVSMEVVDYGVIMKWVGWRQGQGIKSRTLNHGLLSIRYLYASNGLGDPIGELRIRGHRHELLSKSSLLSMEELLLVYEKYHIGGLVGKRNKAILGLLICQGLRRVEIKQLRVEDVDLERCMIRIPETASANSRILPLLAVQLKGLEDYLYQVRPMLLRGESDYLILRANNSYPKQEGSKDVRRMGSMLSVLIRQLRSLSLKISTATQIRQSVITHWLSEHDVRQVQYMSGHRYASSTQAYGKGNLEDLQERIELIHPLNER